MRWVFLKLAVLSGLLIMASLIPGCQTNTETELQAFKEDFAHPPDEARPYTWWHWIHGHITKDGITKDLEWMKEFGLGGAIVFNVGRFSDEVPRPVPFQSEEWWAMVDHAIMEADRLGLKLGFHNCDGWSHSGGPWMEEHESMKKMVWTETIVEAGETEIRLPQPESIRDYYEEIATLAMPVKVPYDQIPLKHAASKGPEIDLDGLVDGDLKGVVNLSGIKAEDPLVIDFEFESETEVSGLSLVTGPGRLRHLVLDMETSADGANYKHVRHFSSRARGILGWRTGGLGGSFTFGFSTQKARFLRMTISGSNQLNLTEVLLLGSERVDLWEAKAGQVQYTEHGGGAEFFFPDPERHLGAPINEDQIAEEVIDLSDRLNEDGELDWTPPPGTWRILRIGQTTTGKTNSPSTLEGRGLEADKLNPDALSKHYSNFMRLLVDREVNQKSSSLAYTEIDSWEAGPQNWTKGLTDIFQEFNGYDMTPFLPVLAGGNVVGNYELSERFLWDFRKTLAHLIREGCFRHLAELAEGDNLIAFSEGSGRQQYLYDPINFQSTAPIPKGEFWIGPDQGALLPDGSPMMAMRPRIDCKVASSVAHIYGGQLAASESFTGGQPAWYFGPFENKMLGDQAYTMGVNWIVLHTSVHQPYDHLKPGFSLGAAGSHFHRNNIIYSSHGWTNYMTRCQYMLRQGLFVADVLVFTGEDVPNYLGFRHELSIPLPSGYDYDGCNAEILEQARVEKGKIVLESGMEYRVLLLPDRPYMSMDLLLQIKRLVSEGATVLGPAPKKAPGLKGFPEQDYKVASLAAEIWGDCDGLSSKENEYGRGKVIWGKSFEEIFEAMDLDPDFSVSGGGKGDLINYIHRKKDNVDIYFVANGEPDPKQLTLAFRAKGKVPLLFDPLSGKTKSLSVYQEKEGSIQVPIGFNPYGSAFIVLVPASPGKHIREVKGPAQAMVIDLEDGQMEAEFFQSGSYEFAFSNGETAEVQVDIPEDFAMDGSWQIAFETGNSDQEKQISADLFAWNESEDPFIKFFSGTATYSKEFDIPAGFLEASEKVYLDLGKVQKIARVTLNGQTLPVLWTLPFRVDVSAYLKEGENRLSVEVTNTWANQMIGDEEYPADLNYPSFHRNLTEMPPWLDGSLPRPTERKTFAITKFFFQGDPLQESGLLGPVVLKKTSTTILQ